jgi:hypothetical protein
MGINVANDYGSPSAVFDYTLDTEGKPVKPEDEASHWLSEIERARRDMQTWNARCEKIRKIYRDDQSIARKRRKYAMLWSNLETLGPAIYTQPPKAVVQRRYKDADQIGRVATEILERAINFTFDANDYDSRLRQVRNDYMLYGRGVARVFYEPVMSTVEGIDQESGLDVEAVRGPEAEVKDTVEEDVKAGEPQEVLEFEHVRIGFVQRHDFLHQRARTWEEVDWVAFRGYLDRSGLIARFGEDIGKQIPVQSHEEREHSYQDAPPGGDKAEIWEIWDRSKQKVLWISKGWPKVLEKGNPYLKLEGFYPCPKPVYATLTSDSLEPIPDYVYYQDQTEEIDRLTSRISALTDSLKLVGFYPAGPQGEGAPEIERAITPGFENKMIAVKSWAAFKAGSSGGEGAPVVWLPIDQVVSILENCITLRKQIIEDVYEIFGISDIMRGQGEANETATAQNIKAQYGSLRVDARKRELARFSRDIARMTGEIIATSFQPETLEKITNVMLPTRQQLMLAQVSNQMPAAGGSGAPSPLSQPSVPAPSQLNQPPAPNAGAPPSQEDVFGILRDGVLRRFRIDIEVDSTVAGNESEDRQSRIEFISSATQFIQTWGPIIAQSPQMAPLAGGLLLFAVRSFRVGRELEELIEETIDKIMQQAANPQPPQPSPDEAMKMQSAQIKGRAEIQKSAIDLEKAKIDGQAKIATIIGKAHADHQKHAMDREMMAAKQAQALIEMQTGLQEPNAASNSQ